MATGNYFYVGDIGYAMTADEWSDAIQLYWDDEFAPLYTFKDGRQFTLTPTEFGDSDAADVDGWNYATDSGLVGVIRANQIDRECMPTVKKMVEAKGARIIRIDATSVADIVERKLSPFGEQVYEESDFVAVEEII